MHRLPSDGFRPDPESRSRRGGISDFVRNLPQSRRSVLGPGRLQSCLEVRPGRRPRRPALRRLPRNRGLSRDFTRLLRLPPVELRSDQESQPRRRGLLDGLRCLPSAHGYALDPGVIQSRDLICPGRRPCRPALRRLPYHRSLSGHAARLLRLPPVELRSDQESQPRRRGLLDGLRCLPSAHGYALDPGVIQSRDLICPGRRPCRPALRRLPYHRSLSGHAARLLRLPPVELRSDQESQPCRVGILDGLRHLPSGHGYALDPGVIQSRDLIRPGRPPRRPALRRLPYQRSLSGHAARLLRLPPVELRSDQESQPCRVGLLDGLRHLPSAHGYALDPGRASITPRRLPWSASTPPSPAPPVTSTGSTRARPAIATAATGRITIRPGIPTTPLPGFSTVCETCHRATDTPLDSGNVQSLFDVRPGRRPRRPALRRLPYQRSLSGHAARLLRLPPVELRSNPESQPRCLRIFDGLFDLPSGHGHVLDAGDVQPYRLSHLFGPPFRKRLHGLPSRRGELPGFHLPDLPYAELNGLGASGPVGVRLQLGELLLLPSSREPMIGRGR